MSYVIVAPEMMTSAATDLAAISSNVSAVHMAAAAPTVAVIPTAADEVSASIAHLFSQHAANYQATAAQAAAFHDQFVQHLTAGAFSFTDIEAAITAFLQDPVGAITNFNGNVNNLIMSVPGLNDNIVLVLALLEAPFAITFLLLTSPIWIPLLILTFPFYFGLLAG